MATHRHPLRFGIVTGQHQLTWPQLVEFWQTAEAFGFDSCWLFDHFQALYADPDGPCLEASTLLAGLALKTSQVQIGVLVYGNTHRHPALLAKEMVTIDHLSGGRAILGIGSGWNEREHRAYSIPFPSPGDRVGMLEEALQVIELLQTQTRTTFFGQYYQLDDAPFAPKPVNGRLPIMVGGERPRMLKVVARHADIWDCARNPDGIAQGLAQITEHCAEIGRDPGGIVSSVSMGAHHLMDPKRFSDLVKMYREVGTSQLLFDFPINPEGIAIAERIAKDLIPRLREELA